MSKSNMLTTNWAAPKLVRTLITTRLGGHSINEFSSFNLALHVNDNPEHVLQNRKFLQQQLPDKPYWLNQMHSNKVVNLDLINHDFTQKSEQTKSLQENNTNACDSVIPPKSGIHKNKDLSNLSSLLEAEDEFNLETGSMPLEYDASITTRHQKICVV